MNIKNDTAASFSTIFCLIIIILLVYFCNIVTWSNAEEPQPSQASVDQQLREIKTELNNLKTEMTDNVNTITLVSEKVLSASERTFNKITWIVGIGAALVTVIVGLLGYFGFKELKDIEGLKEKMSTELKALIARSEQINSEHKTFQQDINSIKEAFKRFQEAELNLRIARDYIINGISYKEGLRIIQDVLTDTMLDNRIKAKAYAMKGFGLKRLNRIGEAFAVLEEAIMLDSTNPIYFLNCACYAALIENVHKTISYINSGIKQWKEPEHDDFMRLLKNEIFKKEDNDFVKIKDNETFKKFLQQIGIC